MTSLPALAAAPVRAAPPTDAAPDDDANGGSGFAAALELAREPIKAPTDGTARAGAKGSAQGGGAVDAKAQPTPDARSDAVCDSETPPDGPGTATDTTTPDLTALLPGWPPAPVVAMLPAPSAVAVAGAADAQGALAVPAVAESGLRVALPAGARIAMRGELQAGVAGPHEATAGALAQRTPTAPDTHAAATIPSAVASEPAPPALPMHMTADSATPAPTWPAGTLQPSQHAMQGPSHFSPNVAAATAPPFEARLGAAIDSPGFAPALANQVTWLVSEGVQQARLSLHPVEMGPLAVKIVLDGSQARIDFSADMPATRAAIEASLPTLAAALHDSGLTLAGGGVFDGRARDGRPDARGAPQAGPAAGGNASASDTSSSPATPIRAARGLVDLVA